MPVRTSTKTVLSVSVSRNSGSIASWSEREADGHSERHRPLYFQALIRLRDPFGNGIAGSVHAFAFGVFAGFAGQRFAQPDGFT